MRRPGSVRRLLLVGIGVLALVGLLVTLALHNWLMALSFAGTAASMTIMLRQWRREDRAHRAEFAARLERARQPPYGRDA